eukprot:356058-Chlamydomonas_euryale.AAC.3
MQQRDGDGQQPRVCMCGRGKREGNLCRRAVGFMREHGATATTMKGHASARDERAMRTTMHGRACGTACALVLTCRLPACASLGAARLCSHRHGCLPALVDGVCLRNGRAATGVQQWASGLRVHDSSTAPA